MEFKKIFNLKRSFFYKILFYAGLFLLSLPILHFKAYSNDLWKALYSGRYLALNLSFPSHSEFAFTPVVEVVLRDAYNWLGNLVFYGIYQLGGVPALQVVIRFGLVIFAVLIIHSLIRYKINPLILLTLFFTVLGIYQKTLLRTAVFIIPFMAIFWWLWYQSREKGKKHLIWGFPVLFLFWGNMHATYLMGFCYLLIVFAGDVCDIFIEKDHPGWSWLGRLGLILIAVFFIITFVKPFPDYQAAQLLSRPLRRGGGLIAIEDPVPEKLNTDNLSKAEEENLEIQNKPQENNVEKKELSVYEKTKRFLQNLFISGAYEERLPGEFSFPLDNIRVVYVVPSFLIMAVILSAFIINYRAVRVRYVLVWLATSLLAAAYMRTLPLVSLVLVPLLFHKYDRGDFEKLKVGSAAQWVAFFACLLIFLNLGYLYWNQNVKTALGSPLHRNGLGPHPRFISNVPKYTLEKYSGERGFNDYNTGTYLIWNWWPDKKVFIDSKSSAYTYEFMHTYRNSYPVKLVKKLNLDHAILPLENRLIYIYFIPHPEWEIEVMDQSFILFVKKEEARSVSPEEYLINTDEELDKLHIKEKKLLTRVLRFIKHNQNDPDKVEKYGSLRKWELEFYFNNQLDVECF